MSTITVEELRRRLQNLSKEMMPTLEAGMWQAVINVEGLAKENCPVITGMLRDSMSSKVEQKDKEIKGIVGAGMEYAAAVHDGTSRRPPKPFILNAIKEKESETLEILSSVVEKTLKKGCK